MVSGLFVCWRCCVRYVCVCVLCSVGCVFAVFGVCVFVCFCSCVSCFLCVRVMQVSVSSSG